MKKLALIIASTVLFGCVSSPEKLAEQGDWEQIGYQDGITGHNQRSYKALSELGSVSQSDYDAGYLKGIAEFCNADFAYQMGLSGQYYEGSCEGTDEAQRFRMEWQRGWGEYNK